MKYANIYGLAENTPSPVYIILVDIVLLDLSELHGCQQQLQWQVAGSMSKEPMTQRFNANHCPVTAPHPNNDNIY